MASPKPKLIINVISETTFTVRGHGVHTAFMEMVAGLRARPDTLVRVNSFKKADITHVHTIGLYSLAALLWGRSKKVISVHVVPDSFIGSLVGAKYWYGISKRYLHFFYNRADALAAVSGEVKDALLQQLKLKKPIEVIFNTVDGEEYATGPADHQAARRQLGIADDQFLVVTSGQVQPRKRFDVFLKLAQAHPKMRFIWVGGIPFKALGAEHHKMEVLMRQAPANLTVTGVIELAEVKPYYQAADAFILPSNQENHPLAVIEAAASGLPIIIRDIHEYDSSFKDDLIRGDDDSFAGLLERLQTDGKFRAAAIAGSKRVAERFDNKVAAAAFVKLYRSLLKERP